MLIISQLYQIQSKSELAQVPGIVQTLRFFGGHLCSLTSLVAQMVKHLPIMWETQVQSLDWEDLLEKKMATHTRILAWKIPWMVEPCKLQSMGCKELDMTEKLHFIHFTSTLTEPFFLIYCFQRIFFNKMY